MVCVWTPDTSDIRVLSYCRLASSLRSLSSFVYKSDDSSSGDNSDEDQIIYELTSDDGFRASGNDINKLWLQVFDAVSEARMLHGLKPLENNPLGNFDCSFMRENSKFQSF